MPEWEFIHRVTERAGCGLLVDLNYLYLSAVNHGFDGHACLAVLPWEKVGEIHLGGYEAWNNVLIDTHGAAVQGPVWEPVWDLFRQCRTRLAAHVRLLIERDSASAMAELLADAARASAMLTDLS